MYSVSSGDFNILDNLVVSVSGNETASTPEVGADSSVVEFPQENTLAIVEAIQVQTVTIQNGFVALSIVGGLLVGICLMLGLALGMRKV